MYLKRWQNPPEAEVVEAAAVPARDVRVLAPAQEEGDKFCSYYHI